MTHVHTAHARGPVSFTGTEWRDAYLIGDPRCPPDPRLIASLTAARLRPVTSWAHPPSAPDDRLTALIRNCSVIIQSPPPLDLAGRNGVTLPVSPHIAAIATQHGVPVIELSWSDHDALLQAKVGNQTIPLSDFLGKTVFPHPPWPAYAFMATRIHDDFQLIRSAIRSAVESDLHIPCIYFEDRRIVTAPCGVRERTREMIRGASLFVADLTHSDSCPDHDSPNTAHEIGMAMAYGIPIVTCARQPRRNLYFLAGDLDAIFWKNEQDLFEQLRAWLNPRRELLGLRIPDQGDEPSRPMSAAFEFDPALQYTGPSMKNQAGN